jgi:hypothetical protein
MIIQPSFSINSRKGREKHCFLSRKPILLQRSQSHSHVHRISIYSGDGNDAVRIDETNGMIPVSRLRLPRRGE